MIGQELLCEVLRQAADGTVGGPFAAGRLGEDEIDYRLLLADGGAHDALGRALGLNPS